MKQTRWQIVNERPSINDLSTPRHLYSFPYRTIALHRLLLRLFVGVWILLWWNTYSISKKERLKNECFSYFWYRKYKLKK